jgi:hypothetical protein
VDLILHRIPAPSRYGWVIVYSVFHGRTLRDFVKNPPWTRGIYVFGVMLIWISGLLAVSAGNLPFRFSFGITLG